MPTPDELDRPTALPRWVTAVDVLSVTIALASFAAAVGGGFKLGGDVLQLSVKTPWPPLLIAVVLATLRHVRYPRPHVLARMLAPLRRFVAREGFKAAWRPFVATRIAVLAIGLLAVYTFGMPTEAKRLGISDSQLVNLPLRFDAGWYLSVARVGYLWAPGDRERGRQQNIVFFPALPMGMRVLGYLFGRSGVGFLYAGVVISHVAFLAALVLLFELARDDLGDAAAAGAAVVLLCTYPFSLFHGAVYTESLYLLGVVGAVLACRRERWTQAMAWGALVGLTRPNGFVLSATLGVLLFETMLRKRSASGRMTHAIAARRDRDRRANRGRGHLLAVHLAPHRQPVSVVASSRWPGAAASAGFRPCAVRPSSRRRTAWSRTSRGFPTISSTPCRRSWPSPWRSRSDVV